MCGGVLLTAMLIVVSLILYPNFLHQFRILKLRDFIIHPLLQKVRAEAPRGEVACSKSSGHKAVYRDGT